MKQLILAMAMMAAGVASAVSFSYQGALRMADGGQIPANERNKTISFRLYDTPTGTDALWGRTIAVHLDDNGLFNVELSDNAGSKIDDVKTNDLAWVLSQYPGKEQNLYIGLDVVGSSGEIRPRQKLLNVPSAAFAADVATAKGDFSVSGKATVEGSITAKKGLEVSNGTLMLGAGVNLSRSGDLAQGIIPHGIIVMWSGAADKIPQGWALCDGGNGTPDLRNRFIVGAGGNYTPEATGGEETVTLNTDQMPSHSHGLEAVFHGFAVAPKSQSYGYNQTYGWAVRWVGGEQNRYNWNYGADEYFKRPSDDGMYPDYLTVAETRLVGGGQPHNNMPPYYALCFIMKL